MTAKAMDTHELKSLVESGTYRTGQRPAMDQRGGCFECPIVTDKFGAVGRPGRLLPGEI